MTFHFVLLAAGFGSRFGSNKLIAELDGKPLFRHGLDCLIALKEEGRFPITVTVVTQYPEIAEAAAGEGIDIAINEAPSRGQTSSIITGVHAVMAHRDPAADDYLIFLAGDQPFIKKESLEAYLARLSDIKPPLACFSADGKYRNPGAFRRDLWPELLDLKGDGGGRPVLKAHADDVMLFTGYAPEELRDIDYPEDLTGSGC